MIRITVTTPIFIPWPLLTGFNWRKHLFNCNQENDKDATDHEPGGRIDGGQFCKKFAHSTVTLFAKLRG